MRRVFYGVLGALIATPAFSAPLNYINYTYIQPDAWYQTCGTRFSYGDRWDGHCGELDDAGNIIERPWPGEGTRSFEAATLWMNETVDRTSLTISSTDTAADWQDDFAYQEWGIIPFGLEFVDLNSWADGEVSRGWLEFSIDFDQHGEISSWHMWGARADGGATAFTFFSEPEFWNGNEYFGDAYFEPDETFIYRDPGYWVSDAGPAPAVIPLPASGLLLLAGLVGMGLIRRNS